MNFSHRCDNCRDFENEMPDGCGHCKTFGGYPYGGNREPCWRRRDGNDLSRQDVEELPAEIERLRAELTRVNNLRETEIDQAGAAERIYLEGVRAKDARIKELEDALAEYQRLGKTIAGKVPCLTLHGDCGRCSAKMREVCGALEQIAGGKIGPDTEPANIQALQRIMRKQHDHPAEMVELNADHQYQPEAPRSWQITEERIRFLTEIATIIDEAGFVAKSACIRAMLEEAGQ